MELVYEKAPGKVHTCNCCGGTQGAYHLQYRVVAKHMRMMGWFVSINFFREKRWCQNCQGNTSEHIDFLCPTSPHITMELAWWLNRLSEVTSVLSVSKLESVDKMARYKVDHFILARLFQGYTIPKVKRISVDEVYTRSKKQMKEGETRDDLFFEMIGPDGCKEIEVVAIDQHDAYKASVNQYCPHAHVVWDRYHLVQKFNEALNEERKAELENIDPEGAMGDLMNGKYRFVYFNKSLKAFKARSTSH